MSLNASKNTDDALKETFEALKERYQQLLESRQIFFHANNSLNRFSSSYSYFHPILKSLITSLSKHLKINEISNISTSDSFNDFSVVTLSFRNNFSKQRDINVNDNFTTKKVMQLYNIFESSLDLTKRFLHIKHIKTRDISLDNKIDKMKKRDPLFMTKLITISPGFLNKNVTNQSKFDELKVVLLRLNELEKKLQDYYNIHIAQSDVTKKHLECPEPSILSRYPQFQQYVDIHKKMIQEMVIINEGYSKQITDDVIPNIDNLNRVFMTSIDNFSTLNSNIQSVRQSYDTLIDLNYTQILLKAVNIMKNKLAARYIDEYNETIYQIRQFETKFSESIIDENTTRPLIDKYNEYKLKLEKLNKEISKYLEEYVEEKQPTKYDNSEGQVHKNIMNAYNEQINDSFKCFPNLFLTFCSNLDNLKTHLSESKLILEHQSFIIKRTVYDPEALYLDHLIKELSEEVNNKVEKVSSVCKEKETIEEDYNIQRKMYDELVALASKENVCPDCFKDRNVCLATCGHTFCEKCFEKLENVSNCPVCGVSFSKNDVISIKW